jgi:hypothetical protein
MAVSGLASLFHRSPSLVKAPQKPDHSWRKKRVARRHLAGGDVRFAFGVLLLVIGAALIALGLWILFRSPPEEPEPSDSFLGSLGRGGAAIAAGVVSIGYGAELVGITESQPHDWLKLNELT